MKALIVSALYSPHVLGGAEKVAQVLAEGLRDAGHQPVVVTTDPRPGLHSTRVNGVPVHSVGLENLYWPHEGRRHGPLLRAAWHGLDSFNPWMGNALAAVVQRERPDVVNSHSLTGFSCAAWPAAGRQGVPVVHTLHDYALLCPRASMRSGDVDCERQCRTCRAYTAPARRLSTLVDTVVGVSRFTLQRHLDAGCFPQARGRVIHNGLPPPRTRAVARPRDSALRLGYVGRLVPAKGIGLLVAAMRAWSPQACTLLVAGRGAPEYEQVLHQLAPGHVRFVGFVDPAELYGQVDVLVVPSLYQDPLPTAVIEAYQHGLPVIAARRGGLPELVEDGRTGRLFDPSEPTTLHEAIAGFSRDPSAGARMQPHIARKAAMLSIDRMLAEYIEVLDAAAGAAPRAATRQAAPA